MNAKKKKKPENIPLTCEGCNLHVHCLATNPISKIPRKQLYTCFRCDGLILIVYREEMAYIEALGQSYGTTIKHEYRVGTAPPCCIDLPEILHAEYLCPACAGSLEIRKTPPVPP
jgi:hypothetical protein